MNNPFTVTVPADVAAGWKGWNTPLEIKAGRHILTVAFIRGVFSAGAHVELEAAANASYELRFTTDARLFGHNSFCDFWGGSTSAPARPSHRSRRRP